MRKTKYLFFTLLTISVISGCELIKNTFEYKDKTEAFVKTLIAEDYNKCVDLLAMEHELARNINTDTLKMGLTQFREVIVQNWGTDLEFSLMKSEKKISTNEAERTPPNTTLMLVEFNNHKYVGVIQALFDDQSKKIINIKTLDIKEPIPTMTYFWLFGLIAICIPLFNIYVIRQIKRSNLNRKWLKYLAVITLNTPAITYAAVSGISFELINLQILFGASFGYMGILSSFWTFGIPLGGIYWFWKLHKQKNEISPPFDNAEPTTEPTDTIVE